MKKNGRGGDLERKTYPGDEVLGVETKRKPKIVLLI